MGKIMRKKKKEKTIQIRVTKEFVDDLTVLTRLFKTTKSQYIVEIIEDTMNRQKELLKNVLTDKK